MLKTAVLCRNVVETIILFSEFFDLQKIQKNKMHLNDLLRALFVLLSSL